MLAIMVVALLTLPMLIRVQQTANSPSRFVFNQVHMGVEVRVTLFAPGREKATEVAQKVFARFAELDNCLSDYQQNSELNRMLRTPGPVQVSKDLLAVLAHSEKLAKQTDGAFDVTLRPLIQLWRSSRRSGVLPTADQISAARRWVGPGMFSLDRKKSSVLLKSPEVKIDFGGIAKGYACDQAVLAARAAGCKQVLVEAGGDLACGDPPPGSSGWEVGIEGSLEKVSLKNQAMSTSGSTEQFVEIGGVRYSHIIDPATGLGVTTLRQVTVIGRRGLDTDPLATAICINPSLRSRFRGVKVKIVDR